MREILFRGKRADNGEWVEGDLSQHKNGKTFIKCGSATQSYEVIPKTIGQYTGKTLCDTRVFKGDIVEWYEDYDDSWGYTQTANGYSVVVWDDENFCWGFDTDGYVQSFNDWDWYNCFVIGNIHDNPELLKGGTE